MKSTILRASFCGAVLLVQTYAQTPVSPAQTLGEQPRLDVTAPNPEPKLQSKSYRLRPTDLIQLEVHGEPDLKAVRRIDMEGRVSLPLIDQVKVADLTVAEAEQAIAQTYIEKQILLAPKIGMTVLEYAQLAVSVIGQVKKPGRVNFPKEISQMSLLDVLSEAEGFTRIARANSVRVSRLNPEGKMETFIVDVQALIEGRSPPVPIYPGDTINVDESIF
jgi:polysaccharide export outer membrane protein